MSSNASAAAPAAEDSKTKKERSPGYPGINLETALIRTGEFFRKERQNPASLPVIAGHWNMTPTSSSTLVIIAALKAFGLISDTGAGDKRRFQVTDLARRILLDDRPDSQERAAEIKKAALSPRMHRTLWAKWGNDLPSDANMRHSLIFDCKFNSNTVGDFIRLYKDTIRFAKLSESDKVPPEVDGKDAGNAMAGGYVPSVGDYVQWEPRGILQFPEAKPITSISGDGKFAFVEGSSTGLPVGELVPHERPSRLIVGRAIPPSSEKSNMRQDVFSLSEGTATIQWPAPLSADSIQDLKDWLKIVERKISRSVETAESPKPEDS